MIAIWGATTALIAGVLALGWLYYGGVLRTAQGRSYSMSLKWDDAFMLPTAEHRAAYDRDDYPRVWPIAPLRPVLMTRENTVHYRFDSTAGSLEWDTLLPSGGAVVHLGPEGRPFTVSISHQLRCLRIINDALFITYAAGRANNDTARTQTNTTTPNKMLETHCMNYMRQMILCRANSRLEPMMARYGATKTVWEVPHRCHDWRKVYDAAEDNYAGYEWRDGHGL